MVTGARTGIGQAIAIALAQAGADLILVGHQDNMQETESMVGQAGSKFETLLIDVADDGAVDRQINDF